MITGFNTDVPHGGRVYHVQTEDRGKDKPVLESLVYLGGTIIAKKQTAYADQLGGAATEEAVASLLKRQHQVIIAAIKAGRIEDLIRHSTKEQDIVSEDVRRPRIPQEPVIERPKPILEYPRPAIERTAAGPMIPVVEPPPAAKPADGPQLTTSPTRGLGAPQTPVRVGKSGGLNLDEVISDYIKRSSEQEKLDVKVLTPSVFTAGKSIGLRVQVSRSLKPETDAIVTVKVIGTAFKPQVYIGRADGEGVASFSLSLPAFTAGTAAIVIEAQSSHGRGELKHLIRRA